MEIAGPKVASNRSVTMITWTISSTTPNFLSTLSALANSIARLQRQFPGQPGVPVGGKIGDEIFAKCLIEIRHYIYTDILEAISISCYQVYRKRCADPYLESLPFNCQSAEL